MNTVEILAPAGSPEVLDAALQAGANAVYFGLKKLNARRGAANFTQEQLPQTVEKIHAAGAKAYLTLNIQLSQRELGLAFRTIQCAQAAHVDAVLVADPAILAVIREFPDIDFHFSTQAAVSSSAGVRAAMAQGIKRVVLARELSADEIAAATKCGIEIETFVQGAHCFSCSGRCLLSSWGGGRSGNRGACTSPCRVRWTNQDGVGANPLSMHDMSLLQDLNELTAAHVASLKIEGRLKSAQWVRDAVTLYRSAIDRSTDDKTIAEQAVSLGNYSGRKLSNAFFHGVRTGLTGESARPSATTEFVNVVRENDAAVSDDDSSVFTAAISSDDRGALIWQISCGDAADSIRIPPQRIPNLKRAVTLQSIVDMIPQALPKESPAPVIRLENGLNPQTPLPKNIRNSILEDITKFMRLKDKEDDGTVRDIALPDTVRQLLCAPKSPCPQNRFRLGDRPTHARLTLAQLTSMAPQIPQRLIVTVTPVPSMDIRRAMAALIPFKAQIDEIALPEVIYENQLDAVDSLLTALENDMPSVGVEINSWDTWEIARHHHLAMTAGPGLAVLNSLAAEHLNHLGCNMATVSCEIDREQLETLSQSARTPIAVVIFSRPKLMITRAILPDGFRPEDHAEFKDARNTLLRPEIDGPVTNLRSVVPMDWRHVKNPKVTVARIIIDYAGFESIPDTKNIGGIPFNYDRRLR